MLVTQLCWTLYDPMDCSPPGSSVMEFSRQEHWRALWHEWAQYLKHFSSKIGVPFYKQSLYLILNVYINAYLTLLQTLTLLF